MANPMNMDDLGVPVAVVASSWYWALCWGMLNTLPITPKSSPTSRQAAKTTEVCFASATEQKSSNGSG